VIISVHIQNDMSGPFLLVLLLAWQLASLQSSFAAATNTGADKNHSSETPQSVDHRATPDKAPVSFRQVESFPQRLQAGELAQQDIPDPHWKTDGCLACHTSNAATARNLRHTQVEKICSNCHTAEFDHRYIHPSSVKPDTNMLAGMAPSMRRALEKNSNTVTCSTCHDLTLQCRPDEKKQQLTNTRFFRAGPYESRSQLCFLCHDKNQYQRLNPHDQIDDKGQLIEEKCRICHADSIAELRQMKSIEQLEFHAADNLSSMCWGCHPWTPHPGGQFSFFKQTSGPNHLVKPSVWIKKQLDETFQQHQLLLPLEPGSGKVFCGTCHNPHEKGVIKNTAAATGADTPRRLRAQKICEYCHDK